MALGLAMPEATHAVPPLRQLILPEPAANRAEPVAADLLADWLEAVIADERDGYALISGAGGTTVVLYTAGRPVEAAQTRGGDLSGARALEALLTPAGGEWFAVSHPLRPEPARCLAGLFAPAVSMTSLRRAGGSLETLFATLRRERFSGTLRLALDDDLWAVALVADGTPLASFGSDDRTLKPDLADVAMLADFDDLSVALHPAGKRDLGPILDTARQAARPIAMPDDRDALIVESLLIEALSTLEPEIAVAEAGVRTLEELTLALTKAYRLLADAQSVIGLPSAEQAPTHPLILPFWTTFHGRLNTAQLLENFRRVGVPNVWWVATQALTSLIRQRIDQQLSWLAEMDPASAGMLAEAAEDIFERAQALTGR